MNIHLIIKEGSGCDLHRVWNPFDAMPLSEQDKVTIGVCGKDESIPEGTNIVFFNRDIITSPEELSRLRDRMKFSIVVDLDDWIELPANHYLTKTRFETIIVPRMIEFLKLADAVFTTNNQLRNKILQFNSNVFVFPNALSFNKQYEKIPSEYTRFGYCGGIAHLPDINLLRHSFQKLGGMEDIRKKAQFILCGFDDRHKSPTWTSMANVFSLTKNFDIRGSLSLLEYMNHYNMIDVSLVPLVDNTFNSCKSILKIVESASCSIPCIVSRVLPYTELQDAPGILWVDKPSDWVKHIRFVTKNPDWIKPAGEALHKYISARYDVRYWAKMRYERLKHIA